MRKILMSMLLLAITLTSIKVSAGSGVTLKINDTIVNYTPAPFIDQKTNRTLVPLRVISEKLGATVEWDGEFKLVTVKLRGNEITIKIGNSFAYLNDEKKTLDQPAVLMKDRTFVPLRFVTEALGAKCEWDANNKTVTITPEALPPEGAFIEPKIEVVTGEDYDPYYFALVLTNHAFYPSNQYEIKTHIDNYQFNTIEYPLADKWYSVTTDGWYPVYPDTDEYYTLPKKYYTTRADNIKIFDGMKVEYTVSLKQISTGKIKDYKGTATIKLQ